MTWDHREPTSITGEESIPVESFVKVAWGNCSVEQMYSKMRLRVLDAVHVYPSANRHWVEKDAMEWSKNKLQQMFSDMVLLDGSQATYLKITGVESVTGEAIINNRKNKVIPSYELEIKLNWEGELRDGSGSAVATSQGFIHLPYVADENHDEDPEVKFASPNGDNATQKLKEAFFASGKKVCAHSH